MMKRILAILLALTMPAGLAACGNSEPKEETNAPEKVESSVESTKPEPSQPEADPFADRETVDLNTFRVSYPDGWYYNADGISIADGWSVIGFYDAQDRDSAENYVCIRSDVEDAFRYREDLYDLNVDLQACADRKLETQTIGGADFIVVPNAGRMYYRHEPTGNTYSIEVDGDMDAENVQALLEGVLLNMEDGDNTDAPWPWEGTPLQPELTPQMVGTFTVTPETVPFEESRWVMDIMEHRFIQVGSQVFHLLADKLDTYEYTDGKLKFVSTMDLDGDYEYITSDNNGMLFLSGGLLSKIIGVKDGAKVLTTTVEDDLTMHPSGTWGISFWVTKDTQKVTNQDGTLTAEPWILTGLTDDASRQGPFSMVDEVEISDSHVMVSGNRAEDNRTIIEVYDLDGNEVCTLGDVESGSPDSFGSITGMAETANGFVAIDGNMRKIQFWDKSGTYIGGISAKDIFGIDYPWLEDMQLLDDGSLLIMATQKRADKSANELVFFNLTGF